jgi:MFS family permease
LQAPGGEQVNEGTTGTRSSGWPAPSGRPAPTAEIPRPTLRPPVGETPRAAPATPGAQAAKGRPKLPGAYWRLWTASTISNIGDGVFYAALPLLAARITENPISVSTVSVFMTLPWLLLSLPAGAVVDRADRRRLMGSADMFRAVLVGVLAISAGAGWVSIWLLCAIGLGLGVAEVLFDNAAQAIVPAVVPVESLERANGWRYSAEIAGNTFIGTPLGPVLLTIAVALPFGVDAASFVVASLLVLSLRGDFRARAGTARTIDDVETGELEREIPPAPSVLPPTLVLPAPTHEGVNGSLPHPATNGSTPHADDAAGGEAASPRLLQGLKGEIHEGLQWLWHRPLLRALAIALGLSNLGFQMGFGIFVLFATQTLGVSERGFGILLACMAVGAIAGGVVGDRIVGKLGKAQALISALVIWIFTMIGTGLAPAAWVVAIFALVESLAATVWNVVTVSLRQEIVPQRLFGRVNSVYRWFGWGGIPIGGLLGGIIANAFGLRAPYFFGAAIVAVALLVALPHVTPSALEQATRQAHDETA